MLKRIITVLSLFCIVFTMFSGAAVVHATELEDAVTKKNELQKQLNEITEKLNEIKDEVKKAQSLSSTYTERKEIVQQQIDALKTSIDLKRQELAIRQQQLDDKQKELDNSYAMFKQRLRAIYMSNNASELSVLLGADSFSEFLVGAETLRRISQHDTDLMEKIKVERAEIEQAKIEIEQQLADLESDCEELESKYDELAQLLKEANNQLSTAEAMKAATENDYAEILEDLEAANAEIDRLMKQASEIEYVGGYYAWPVPGYGWISSGFGWRKLYGKDNYHAGIDIAGSGIYGKNIIASNSGKVVTVVYGSTGYGYYVIIDHGGNYKTLYGHMSSISVKVGDWVSQGDVVGHVGSTGNSTGPHLHFEIRINGEKVNPTNMLVGRPADY